ncbi:hypothetical protein B0H19DRAFT_1245369 [Mycena capillaripes]|nr:hypothetical protein B0H19DRAFT_1245369 [Mycena capillaripes]
MPLNINDSSFICPKFGCGRILYLQHAKRGSQKNRHFICCDSVDHIDRKRYWFFFRPGEAPTRPTTMVVHTAAPPILQQPNANKAAFCAYRGCLKRPHKFCDNKCCRAHCLTNYAQCRQHCSTPLPVPQPPLPPLSSFAQQALDNINAHALQTITFTPPSTPATTLSPSSQEEADINLAIAQSLKSAPGLSTASSSTLTLDVSFNNTHRIELVYWAANGGAATISAVDSCPTWPHTWPHFRLLDVPHLLLDDTDTLCDDFFECYSTKYRSWMRIPIHYVHHVTTDQSLLIRRIGVIGSDEHQHIHSLLARSTTPEDDKLIVIHDRKGKRRAEVIEILDSDDDDEEFKVVAYRPRSPKIKIEPTSPRRAGKRPRLMVTIPSTPPSSLPSLSSSTMSAPTSAPPSSPDSAFPFAIYPAKRN